MSVLYHTRYPFPKSLSKDSAYFIQTPFDLVLGFAPALVTYFLYQMKLVWILLTSESKEVYERRVRREKIMLYVVSVVTWASYCVYKLFEIGNVIRSADNSIVLEVEIPTLIYRATRLLYELFLTFNYSYVVIFFFKIKTQSSLETGKGKLSRQSKMLLAVAVISFTLEVAKRYTQLLNSLAKQIV